MTQEKATARPWRREHNGRRLEIKADTGEWSSMIAQVYKSGRCNANSYRMPADANAELIVTAVNQHDALLSEVATLKNALFGLCAAVESREATQIWTAMVDARAALAGKER